MAEYCRPFLQLGEDRRPTLSWPRNLPIEVEPQTVVRVVEAYGAFLAESQLPKLFIKADPGAFLAGRLRDFCRTWPNQTEISSRGCISCRRIARRKSARRIADPASAPGLSDGQKRQALLRAQNGVA